MPNNHLSFKIIVGFIMLLVALYLCILGIDIFLTWDFCNDDKLNLSRFFMYQVNTQAYCYYSIFSSSVMILIPICICGFIFLNFYVVRRYGYEVI